MNITFLALAALLQLGDKAPVLIEPMRDMDACVAKANKLNVTDDDLKERDAAIGLSYVCMRMVLPL